MSIKKYKYYSQVWLFKNNSWLGKIKKGNPFRKIPQTNEAK